MYTHTLGVHALTYMHMHADTHAHAHTYTQFVAAAHTAPHLVQVGGGCAEGRVPNELL